MKTNNDNCGEYSIADTNLPCILVYDDDPEILLLCNEILAKSQYRVKTLLRCDNVIKDITCIKPDIILMDLWIPEIGGEKAITIIKANKETRDIPIIIFSANREIEEICEKTKADDYVRKPFDIADFKDRIETNLKLRPFPISQSH